MRKYKTLPSVRTRVRDGILIFPKTINGETRWLEWAMWNEELIEIDIHGEKFYDWIPTRWRGN